MSTVEGQIQYAMEKAGKTWDPAVFYTLTTPTQVAGKVAQGFVKECTFSPRLGEKIIVLSPPKVKEEKPKKKSKTWRKK